VDGFAKRESLQEIGHFEIADAWQRDLRSSGMVASEQRRNLFGEEDLDEMTRLAALGEAQSAFGDEAPHRIARNPSGEACVTGEAANGKAQLRLAFEPAMPKQMDIDGALGQGETQARDEQVYELLPNARGVELFVFH
jgi:hypothetical protein